MFFAVLSSEEAKLQSPPGVDMTFYITIIEFFFLMFSRIGFLTRIPRPDDLIRYDFSPDAIVIHLQSSIPCRDSLSEDEYASHSKRSILVER